MLYFTTKREGKRLANGWSYEPSTNYIKNTKALELESSNVETLKHPHEFKMMSKKIVSNIPEKAAEIDKKQKVILEH